MSPKQWKFSDFSNLVGVFVGIWWIGWGFFVFCFEWWSFFGLVFFTVPSVLLNLQSVE